MAGRKPLPYRKQKNTETGKQQNRKACIPAGRREVFTRYIRSIFRNKALVFKASGYREMREEIRANEEAEKKAAVRKAKEERKRIRKAKSRVRRLFKKKS